MGWLHAICTARPILGLRELYCLPCVWGCGCGYGCVSVWVWVWVCEWVGVGVGMGVWVGGCGYGCVSGWVWVWVCGWGGVGVGMGVWVGGCGYGCVSGWVWVWVGYITYTYIIYNLYIAIQDHLRPGKWVEYSSLHNLHCFWQFVISCLKLVVGIYMMAYLSMHIEVEYICTAWESWLPKYV